jgi:NAD+ synthase (glutamine-hydrolysing)
MRELTIGGAALNQTPIDWDNNLENIRQAIEGARQRGIDVLCLPELCITGYGCEDLFLSDWLHDKAMEQLVEITAFCHDITVAVGLPVKLNERVYNCAALICDGALQGFAAKQHLANDGVHYEPRWFTRWLQDERMEIEVAGKTVPFGDVIFDVNSTRIGFEICEDAWRENRPGCKFPERGVELILNPSASHFGFGKTIVREKLIRKGSGRFNCYYLYTNLLGNEAGRMIYDGEILIAGHGHFLGLNKKLSFQNVNIFSLTIDLDDHDPSEQSIDIPVEEKYDIFVQAQSLALFDYLRKSRSRGFVLSLSGGADSSTCAILVAEMVRRSIDELGWMAALAKLNFEDLTPAVSKIETDREKKREITRRIFTCAYQGTVNSSSGTLNSARQLAEEIGATFHHWLIDDAVHNYRSKVEHALDRQLTWENDDLALQNIQSRARSPIIWMLANINNALLLVTSNRSEGDVGYATMDGDTSGSIAPIAAVDKFFILNWLKWAEMQLNYNCLKYVNSLQPTAELRPPEMSQTDEDDLMPYKVIVKIEELAIRERKSPLEVFNTLKEERLEDADLLKKHIRKFYRLWSKNQWKRERTAPAFHLDDFNIDPRTWCRFPILSSGFENELALLDEV